MWQVCWLLHMLRLIIYKGVTESLVSRHALSLMYILIMSAHSHTHTLKNNEKNPKQTKTSGGQNTLNGVTIKLVTRKRVPQFHQTAGSVLIEVNHKSFKIAHTSNVDACCAKKRKKETNILRRISLTEN